MFYYISDLHFGHANIIDICSRPFLTVEEMNNTLIDNWNRKVKDSDVVYIVGDFAHRYSHPENILKQLNGSKILIEGNHDKSNLRNPEFRKSLDRVYKTLEIYDSGQKLVLSHYPMVEWNGYFKGTLHIYGHIHNNIKNRAYRIMKDEPNAFNAAAEILDYTPRTLDELIELNRKFVSEN